MKIKFCDEVTFMSYGKKSSGVIISVGLNTVEIIEHGTGNIVIRAHGTFEKAKSHILLDLLVITAVVSVMVIAVFTMAYGG